MMRRGEPYELKGSRKDLKSPFETAILGQHELDKHVAKQR